MKDKIMIFLAIAFIAGSPASFAEGWCTFESGYQVTTHGVKSNTTYIVGKFEGETRSHWIKISDGTIGEANISVALAAQLAGKKLSIYLDGADDQCDNIVAWYNDMRHLRIID